ncbi:4'-phosphopantetheinyl transferase EntD [Kitasatospora sp. MAA4]|uniref:4'-phosphopantetheinyl transferase family protein n=1 Tax=Kitasatospora sp. MAA4 TaxID=3035093 RepID=UPI002475CB95|nr:4'-phosphopantetheinyl transferase superfamily protein [Kitasatospora sp. MAA4]MDH6134266.1 4'-phosphopantetheinyl transferase EntD [Kitasatospora sp. MAA4]
MIGELLPATTVVEISYEDLPQARLEPAEEAAIAQATESRRREYTTVRHCARTALGRLGVPYRPLLAGTGGAPSWPDGVVGSMTHCAGFRGAAVDLTRNLASLGIDAEPDEPLPHGVLERVALPGEHARVLALLAGRPRLAWDRLLFSAKEAVYKAWFPLTGRYLDFPEADIVIDPGGTFHATLLVPGPVVGDRRIAGFDGRWTARGGLLATATTVSRPI